MGTRKNDFIDNFWIRDAIERRSLPQKKDIIQNYKNLQTVDTTQLNESVYQKADLLFKKTLSKQITEENKSIGSKDWEIVSTPYGLFYFNKTTNQWMNFYGVLFNSFEDLIKASAINLFDDNLFSEGKQNVGQQIIFSSEGGEYLG